MLATAALALGGCLPGIDGGGQDAGGSDGGAPAPTAATTTPTSPTPTAPDTGSPRPTASSAAPPASTSPAGTVVRLRIERQTDDVATADFVATALDVLTDDRGWRRAGFAFELDEDAPFLLVLAEPAEVDRLCLPYDTGGRFSCQNGPVVALNADRWRQATETWTGSLAAYRTYLVNHEVGHLLHLHHPRPQCPGAGLPAPVMLQQSTELGACTANPWPLPWEVDLAATRAEPLAPPADHGVDDHRPSPPPQEQDLQHRAVQS